MTVNLKTCGECSRYLVSLGWHYFAHPPLADHFGREKAPEYQCSLTGVIQKLE